MMVKMTKEKISQTIPNKSLNLPLNWSLYDYFNKIIDLHFYYLIMYKKNLDRKS